MEKILLKKLKWDLPYASAMKALRICNDDEDEFAPIYEKCMTLIAPKAYFARAEVTENDGQRLKIGGIAFESHILCVNFKEALEVYPYVVTSGRAAYDYARGLGDPLYEYWADTLCELALRGASADATETARTRAGLDKLYGMNPGSLPDWPISQQAPLFSLLGDVEARIGVTLTPSYLMLPVKSVSGIWFASKEKYTNCSLCPRHACPSRRAPFDENAFARKYSE